MLGTITMGIIIIIIIFHFLPATFLGGYLLLEVLIAIQMQTVIEQVNDKNKKFDSFKAVIIPGML